MKKGRTSKKKKKHKKKRREDADRYPGPWAHGVPNVQSPKQAAVGLELDLDFVWRPGQLQHIAAAFPDQIQLPDDAMFHAQFHRLVTELAAAGKVSGDFLALIRGRKCAKREPRIFKNRRRRDMRLFARVASAVSHVVRRGEGGVQRVENSCPPPSLPRRRWRWCSPACEASPTCGRGRTATPSSR